MKKKNTIEKLKEIYNALTLKAQEVRKQGKDTAEAQAMIDELPADINLAQRFQDKKKIKDIIEKIRYINQQLKNARDANPELELRKHLKKEVKKA